MKKSVFIALFVVFGLNLETVARYCMSCPMVKVTQNCHESNAPQKEKASSCCCFTPATVPDQQAVVAASNLSLEDGFLLLATSHASPEFGKSSLGVNFHLRRFHNAVHATAASIILKKQSFLM